MMEGMRYRIITPQGRKTKVVWEGIAMSVRLAPTERTANDNTINFVIGHSYGTHKLQPCISIGVEKIPNQLIMEQDGTLWLGESATPRKKDILWRCKPTEGGCSD